MESSLKSILDKGTVIPASPLALDSHRKLDERRQRALYRYYHDAGVGGIAVGVHTTQFEIRDPQIGLFAPILKIASNEMEHLEKSGGRKLIKIAGVCGDTPQALKETCLAAELGYDAVLLSLAALKSQNEDTLIAHCTEVSKVLPLIGFYLQPAVGGMVLPYSFWRRFAKIENVAAIKIAPFNRYQTHDVVRAVAESEREDIALYTGNDDNIVLDLITPYSLVVNRKVVHKRIVGGLLGHWSVWTKKAVELLEECHRFVNSSGLLSVDLLSKAVEVTDSNAAFFDAANQFRGCIAGLHEVLHRQGLLQGIWCINPNETLSSGQAKEIERIYKAYPHLNDDDFVSANLDKWLA